MKTAQLRFYIKYLIIGLLIGFIIGGLVCFFIGNRTSYGKKTETKYVKGKTIIDTVYIAAPYSEKKAEKDNLIPVYKKDSTGKETFELDTTKSKDATIHDWNLERKYANLIFDNENGKLLYDITVQNNKLSDFKYSFTPIQKVITETKEKVFQPYISGSYSTLDIAGIGGGLFYHNLGFEYQYQKDFRSNSTGHSFGIKYKF